MSKLPKRTAHKITSLFAPGSKGAKDPDYVREYLSEEDAISLIEHLTDADGKPSPLLSVPDAFIIRRIRERLQAGTKLTNQELVVLLHIQGAAAAFASSKL